MIPVRQAAKQLGISHERMRQYIRAGRVPGAVHDPHFSRWLVPSDFVVLPPKGLPSEDERLRAKRVFEQTKRGDEMKTPITASHTLVDEHGRHVVFSNVAECIEREHAALREALSNLLRCVDNADSSAGAEDEARAILAATEPK